MKLDSLTKFILLEDYSPDDKGSGTFRIGPAHYRWNRCTLYLFL
jgi:hypothetical protein